MRINYEPYRMSRLLTVQDLVSADYLTGKHPFSMRHMHQNAWELCVCLESQIMVMKDDRYIPLNKGQFLLIHPKTTHDILAEHRECRAFVICFTCNDASLRPLQDAVLEMRPEWNETVFKLISELEGAFFQYEDSLRLYRFVHNQNSPIGADQMICSYLEQFLIMVLRDVTMSKGEVVTTEDFREAIHGYLAEQVDSYIENHLKERLNVEEIADYFHYSRAHLSTLYKAVRGLSIGESIMARRIRRAKTLLLARQMTIAKVAEEVGFSTSQYFTHRFTLEVGCTPTKYIEQVRRSSPHIDASAEDDAITRPKA